MGNCNFLGQVKWRENYYRVKVPVEPRWGGGGGGVLRISSHGNDRMIEFKQNPKNFLDQKLTPKKCHDEFPNLRNSQRAVEDITHNKKGSQDMRVLPRYHESSDCFEYPKKSLLKSSHPKQYLPNFCYPKQNLGIENFKTPPKIVQSSPSLELRCTPPPPPPPHTHTHLLGVKQNLFKGHFT